MWDWRAIVVIFAVALLVVLTGLALLQLGGTIPRLLGGGLLVLGVSALGAIRIARRHP